MKYYSSKDAVKRISNTDQNWINSFQSISDTTRFVS